MIEFMWNVTNLPSGGFPSKSDEMAGRFVGFSENVGHQMTYIILTEETNMIIYLSRVKLAALQPNKQLKWDPGGLEDDHHNNNEASYIEQNNN